MRFGIEAQRLFRPRKHGLEIVALEIINELQLIDKKNEYFIFVRDDVDKDCIQATDNFHIVVLPAANYGIWEQFVLPRAVGKYHLDLLHCTANTAPLEGNIPTLVTIHDLIFMDPQQNKGSAYQTIGNMYRKLVVPRVARKNHIITVSFAEREKISKQLHIPKEHIEVVYNGVNKKFRKISDPAQLREAGNTYNLPEKFMLFFSNPAPKKNTERVLGAFADYLRGHPEDKDLHLVVIDATGQYVEGLLEKMQLREFASRIRILGFVDAAHIVALYNLAAVYCYPSLLEGFGLPIVEAQACGTPVITSNTSSMPEVAGDAAIIVDPYRQEEITRAIENILGDGQKREWLIQKGFQNAERFNWTRSANQLLSLYERYALQNSK